MLNNHACFADELEREEFFRLKKVQDKKKKIRKEKEAMMEERKARGRYSFTYHVPAVKKKHGILDRGHPYS